MLKKHRSNFKIKTPFFNQKDCLKTVYINYLNNNRKLKLREWLSIQIRKQTNKQAKESKQKEFHTHTHKHTNAKHSQSNRGRKNLSVSIFKKNIVSIFFKRITSNESHIYCLKSLKNLFTFISVKSLKVSHNSIYNVLKEYRLHRRCFA